MQACAGDVPADGNHFTAGTLTVTGGRFPITLTDQDGGSPYPFIYQSAQLFDGGETLTIAAEGRGPIPAFSKTILAPSAYTTVTQPTWDAGDETPIDGSQDLTLRWTGGSIGSLWLYAEKLLSVSYFTCEFPIAQGIGTIPSTVLSLFRGLLRFVVGVRSHDSSQIGSYAVSIDVYGTGVTATGQTLDGYMRVQ